MDYIMNSDYKLNKINENALINNELITKNYVDMINNMDFIIEDIGYIYDDKADICIEKYYYSYEYIEPSEDIIYLEGCYMPHINLKKNIFNEYEGSLRSRYIYTKDKHIEYLCKMLCQCELKLYIKNLIITIEGKIGCKPFKAHYKYSGIIS